MKISLWLSGLLLVAILYGWLQYERVFDSYQGYIYDPATGDLYEVEFAPTFSRSDPWRNLNPFADVPYYISSESGVLYRGRLDELIADEREWRVDTESKYDELIRETKRQIESRELFGDFEPSSFEDYFYLYATDYLREDIAPNTLLPAEWAEMVPMMEGNDTQVYVADVVFGGWANNDKRNKTAAELKVISPALILREGAFFAVESYCLQNLRDDILWKGCR